MIVLIRQLEYHAAIVRSRKPELSSLLKQAAAEIERLQAIVDELPKTADGVPVVPGMAVYRRDIGQAHVSVFSMGEVHFSGGPTTHVDSCYSTREAAESKEKP